MKWIYVVIWNTFISIPFATAMCALPTITHGQVSGTGWTGGSIKPTGAFLTKVRFGKWTSNELTDFFTDLYAGHVGPAYAGW